jgi:hypothetical protein
VSNELTIARRAPYEDLRVMIGRMDGKLDIVLATTVDQGRRLAELEAWRHRMDDMPSKARSQEGRLDTLEAWKNRWLGWTLASAFAGGGGVTALAQLFR